MSKHRDHSPRDSVTSQRTSTLLNFGMYQQCYDEDLLSERNLNSHQWNFFPKTRVAETAPKFYFPSCMTHAE
jgi:hypothetical protein